MPLHKLDMSGEYTPFPGVTIIAPVLLSDSILWQRVFNILNETHKLKNYYSLLPCSSYHMTTTNLYTELEVGTSKWREFFAEKKSFFQSINEMLTQNTFSPIITINSVEVSGAIQLFITLPETQTAIIQDIAKRHMLTARVPSSFHITLAYQYKHVPKLVVNELKILLEKNILALFSPDIPLLLNPPMLSSFKDMTQFEPWSGTEFPFEERAAERNSFFLTSSMLKKEKEFPGKESKCSLM